MNSLLMTCPICEHRLTVTRLHCRNCDTTIEGHFETGRMGQLTAEQLSFVETFLRCEGKLNRVEGVLGLSYPTLRSRLSQVIQAMGFEVGPEQTDTSDEQRHQILDELASGQISSEQAMELLQGA
ncbi:MAG TPA: DUF2089 domain-containing protein [Anaerolineales bacterium]|nr:DUF2089 domain-containing protein [Anaerolineales bacterium]